MVPIVVSSGCIEKIDSRYEAGPLFNAAVPSKEGNNLVTV